jgi:lactate dehydrogenase-like 2-hydroxyacid dehydrogenase
MMAGTAVLLLPDTEASKARLSELNGISRRLGGAVEFRLVDSTLPLDEIARQCAGAIALHPGGFRIFTRAQITELVGMLPGVKLIQAPSSGTDGYDKAILAERGVQVANNGGANAVAVAEHAIAMIVAVYRKLDRQIESVKSGTWMDGVTRRRKEFHTLAGKRVGIVGLGRTDHASASGCRARCRWSTMTSCSFRANMKSGAPGGWTCTRVSTPTSCRCMCRWTRRLTT